MSIFSELRFRLGSARHARKLHQEIAALRKERDELLRSGVNEFTNDVRIGDESKVGEREASIGYGIPAHYRQRVGQPAWYDRLAMLQVMLLGAAGLTEEHYLADVGCGSLRAGRMLIPYLLPGHYFGIEPEKWLTEEGLKKELGQDILDTKKPTFRFVADFSIDGFEQKFDYILSQSVYSHTYPDLTRYGFEKMAGSLSKSGKFLATFREAAPGKSGPKWVPTGQLFSNGWMHGGGYDYYWEEIEEFLSDAGLVGKRLGWPHPTQHWFVACKQGSEAEEEIEQLSQELQAPRPNWGWVGRTKDNERFIYW